MKLKSKHKLGFVALLFVLSWFGLFNFPNFGFGFGIPILIVSMVMLLVTAGYGFKSMLDANLFERFDKWLNTDDM